MDLSQLFANARENVKFLLVCLIIVICIFVVSSIAERFLMKEKRGKLKTREIAIIGMLSAVAVILIVTLEIPLPFAPSFYKLDFSELPVIIGSFALGPVAGVLIELVKILLKLVIKGTTTAFVGDFANFVIGCSFIVPAAIIYHVNKSRKSAVIGLAAGTFCMTIFGSAFNGIYLLPKFAEIYGTPLDAIIGMGTAVNANITSVWTLVLFAVVPFNLLKGAVISIITLLIYKQISRVIKGRV